MKNEYRIREARKSDCVEIHRLIQELANYEKLPEGPKFDHKDLERDGFESPQPFFHCFVAEEVAGEQQDTGKIFGYVLYFWSYSTWHGRAVVMEDLYVSPDWRGRGVGKALWKACARAGIENGCSRLDFIVLNWNVKSIEFYKLHGATDITADQGWLLFSLQSKAMEKMVQET